MAVRRPRCLTEGLPQEWSLPMSPHPSIRPVLRPELRAEARKRLAIGTIALMAVVLSCLASARAQGAEVDDPAAGGGADAAGQGRRRRHARGPARHRHGRDCQRPDPARPRDSGLPQHQRQVDGGDLPLSAARRRRGRHDEDGGRPARHRRPHQAPGRGAGDLRPGQGRGAQGRARRIRPAQPVPQQRGQCRPRRDRAGLDRVPGAGPPARRRVRHAAAAGRRRALRPAA